MALQIFDLHVEAGLRGARDLANLAFFGTGRVLACGPQCEAPQSPRELLERFERLLTVEAGRLKAAGLTPHAALGVEAAAVPRRGLREVLLALPAYLSREGVAALGPLSLGDTPRQEEALKAQLALAAERGLPCVLSLPRKGKLRAMGVFLSAAAQARLAPARLAFEHADARALLRARAAGAWAILTVHPEHLSAEAAVKAVARQGAARVMFTSSLGSGPADILALPKVALQLGRAGLAPEEIDRAMHGNALEFLKLA
jgi:uncharacterized protein